MTQQGIWMQNKGKEDHMGGHVVNGNRLPLPIGDTSQSCDRGLFETVNDWIGRADLTGRLTFPQDIVNTTLRPEQTC